MVLSLRYSSIIQLESHTKNQISSSLRYGLVLDNINYKQCFNGKLQLE